MSGRLMGQVFRLVLTHAEQLVLLAICDHADDQGRNAFPSIAYLTWKTGYSKRQVQVVMARLRKTGALIPERYARGGRSHATEYRFLRRLQNLISQPVVPGREMDYLITQTMAEYLAHVHRPRFDGFLYKSVQRAGGTNIVVFPRGGKGFPLTYSKDSFELHSTRSIEYQHRKRYLDKHDEGEVWIGSSEDDWDDDE